MTSVPEDIKDNNLGLPITPSYQLYDTDSTSRGLRPATIIQALMEQAPGDVLAESFQEISPLVGEVRIAQDATSSEDRYVLDAISVENVTYAVLADRLGVSQTQAHRMYHSALDRLRIQLLASQKVREHIGMDMTWENACSNELLAISSFSQLRRPPSIDRMADCFEWASGNYQRGFLLEAEDELTELARFAIDYLEAIGRWDLGKQVDLMAQKHHDYGVDNINLFGAFGVIVRLSDKMSRLANLTESGAAPRNESILDTYRDIIGYVTIYRMLNSDVFNLPQQEQA